MIFVLGQFLLTWCLPDLVALLTSTSVIPTVRPRAALLGTVVDSWSSHALVPVVERYIAKISYSLYSVIFLACLCLFVCFGFIVPLENISLIWRRHHYRWRTANFGYARHSLPLTSEGSLACQVYGGTGHPFIMVISEDPCHSHIHLLPSVWQWSCHYLFLRLRSVVAGIQTPNLPLARRTL